MIEITEYVIEQFAIELLEHFLHKKRRTSKYRSISKRRNGLLTQKAIGELFGKKRSIITKHLKNIFASGELEEKSNVQRMHFSHSDKPIKFYNFDVIISVGYRVNSYQATQFRIWAAKALKEYIIKGFVLDGERLKQGNQVFGRDYFEELLERIREIRTLEQIRDALLPKLMSGKVRVEV